MTASLELTRQRLADAPAWVRATIDQERQMRGLPVLFSKPGAKQPKPTPARPRRPGIVRTLVGAAAPGISSPHRLDVDGGRELLPETIGRTAWEGVQAALARGETFAFQTTHEGKPFAYSNDPDVSIRFDQTAGLLFEIRGEAAHGFSWPAGGFASVGFVPQKWAKRWIGGQWVREIQKMALRHIALLRPTEEPAYRQARVLSVPPAQAPRAFLGLRLDARAATREAGL